MPRSRTSIFFAASLAGSLACQSVKSDDAPKTKPSGGPTGTATTSDQPRASKQPDLRATGAPTPVKETAGPAPGKAVVAKDPGMKRLTDIAKADAAMRAGVSAEQIEVLEARYVTWPDGSAGCPEPGHMYTQATTNGALIRLRLGNSELRYHSSQNLKPFLCKNPVGEPIEYEFGDK